LFAHTLVFSLVFIAARLLVLISAHDVRLLAMSIAVLTHLLSDPVTHSARVLFWPAMGVDFERITLLGTAATIAEELGAAAMLLTAAYCLQRMGRLRAFLVAGRP
jgi:membrane-bound metal-dependent hydrolase YbcI (DUF457 family)